MTAQRYMLTVGFEPGTLSCLTPYSCPIYPLYSPSTPHRPAPRGWRPAIQLDFELN